MLEKKSEAASKSTSNKKSLSAVTILIALSRTSESEKISMIVWIKGLGVGRELIKPEGMMMVLAELSVAQWK